MGKTIRECPVCESVQLEYEFVVDKAPVCSCKICGLLFLNPQPSEDVSVLPLETSQAGFTPEIFEANAAERIRELMHYSGVRTGKLLLIGADSHMIAEATKLQLEVLPYSAVEFESIAPSQFPGGIELCLLFCSLERMRDPLAALSSIRGILGESGALMVVSAITDSPAAHLFRNSWWGFNRSTLFYFSTDTLQSLLIKAGFGDPIINPDRSLVSLNYLTRRLASNPRAKNRYRALQLLIKMSPFLRNKAFRLAHGRTRLLVRGKPQKLRPVLSVIVPVYNEKATCEELIDQLMAKSIEGVDIQVIIVESNSSDGTRELVLNYQHHPRVTLIMEEKPRGKGHAVRTGLAAATGDVVLFQDADLEYDINDYDALIAPILRFENNFVLGTRHGSGKNWKIREFSDAPVLASFFNLGHVLFLTLFNVIYRQRLSDPFTMFKVFRRDCLWGLSFECNRFDFDYEIVIKLLRKGYKAFELPVNYKSRSIKEGKKVTVFRDPLTWIRALLKFRKSPLYSGDVQPK